MRPNRRAAHWSGPLFAMALLLPLGLFGQPAGPTEHAESGPGLNPAMDAVRAAWLLPEAEAKALLETSSFSPADFAVAGMLSHQERVPLAAVAESRKELGSWTAVLNGTEGTLHDTVFKGNPRYPLDSPPPAEGANPANSDERIVELAEVMTLERLTGKSPAVLVKELDGSSFEILLTRARPGESPGGSEDRPGEKRPRGREGPRSRQGPPGVPRSQDRPGEVRGWVGSGS